MTNHRQRCVGARPASDRSGDDNEHLAEPIHQDHEENTSFHVLRAAIQDGLSSGRGDRTPRGFWAEAEQRFLARNG